MECPRCDEEMIVVEYQNVEVDYCEEHGVWLDRGELELLMELAGTKPGQIEFTPTETTEETLRCAYCGEPMEKIRVAGLEDIIDRCPKRHGLWFDKGELRRVLSVATVGAAVAPLVQFLQNLFPEQPVCEEGEEA